MVLAAYNCRSKVRIPDEGRSLIHPAAAAGRRRRYAAGLLLGWVLTAGCAGSGESPESVPDAAAAAAVSRDGSASWSPDGEQLVFYSERDGNAEIYRMGADGSNPVRLTDSPANDGYPAFSPDGTRISFDSNREGNFEIFTMNADGSGIRRLTYNPANDVSAAWSPDGQQIAWMSNRSGRFEVWLMNADGSGQRQLTGDLAPSAGTHWFPQFSPDGNRLAFHVERDVHTVGVDGSDYTRLTEDPDNGMVPSWTPSGEQIVFMSWRTGATEIFIMNADGSEPRRLTTTAEGESVDPRVSPDGQRIVYTWVPAGGAGPKHVMLMDIDGNNIEQLTGGGS